MAVRLGFFGAGFIAEHHANMLRGCDEVKIVAVYDPEVSRAERFADAHGATVATSEEALLESCDAAYICTWTSEHSRLVAAAADSCDGVFCEKPLARDLPAARELAAVLEASGVVNQVGLVLRDSPAFALLRSWMDDPADGRLLSVVFRDDQYLPTQGIYGSTWRADPAKAGSGTLLEHSIHDLDLLEWLIGPTETVTARSSEFHGLDGIEDVVTVLATYEGGVTATLTSVWHDVLSRPSGRRVEVFRERAWYALEGDVFGPVRRSSPDAAESPEAGEDVYVDDSLLEELARRGVKLRNPDRAFARAVAAGEPASPDVGVALRAHEVVDAAYRSAAAGGLPVSLG